MENQCVKIVTFEEYFTVEALYQDLKNLIGMGYKDDPIMIFFKDQSGEHYLSKLKAISKSIFNVEDHFKDKNVVLLFNDSDSPKKLNNKDDSIPVIVLDE